MQYKIVYVELLVTFIKQTVLWKFYKGKKMCKLVYTVLNIPLICIKMSCCNLSCSKVWKRYVVWNMKYAFNLLLPKYIVSLWAAVCLLYFFIKIHVFVATLLLKSTCTDWELKSLLSILSHSWVLIKWLCFRNYSVLLVEGTMSFGCWVFLFL